MKTIDSLGAEEGREGKEGRKEGWSGKGEGAVVPISFTLENSACGQ